MKKSLSVAITLAALMAPAAAFAEGYAIIEHTTEGVAMGGAAMFIENDAGNMAYNPAGITLCEGEQLKMSATYISPHGYSKTYDRQTHNPLTGETQIYPTGYNNDNSTNTVHPAWVPGTYYVRKIDDKQWWGIGCFTRFGNMSEFEAGTLAATSSKLAKMKGLSITPTYAHKAGRKFYWAVGADINYVGLELQKNFDYYTTHSDAISQSMRQAFAGNNKTEGETWALGWNVGLRYAPTDKDEIGFAYRSKIAHTMDADFDWYGVGSAVAMMFQTQDIHTRAHGKVTLPDSYHLGYSHRFDKKNRVEIGAIRTQWHNFKTLNISMDNGLTNDSIHNWKDTWRYAIGFEHKFSKKYTGMMGFAFDDSCIPYEGGDYMVPTGCRRTYSIGMKYTDRWHTIAFTVGYQKEGPRSFGANNVLDGYGSAHSYDCSAKIFSIGYTYHF